MKSSSNSKSTIRRRRPQQHQRCCRCRWFYRKKAAAAVVVQLLLMFLLLQCCAIVSANSEHHQQQEEDDNGEATATTTDNNNDAPGTESSPTTTTETTTTATVDGSSGGNDYYKEEVASSGRGESTSESSEESTESAAKTTTTSETVSNTASSAKPTEAPVPTAETTTKETKGAADTSSRPKRTIITDETFDASNEDWGSYYDPKNIFCGVYDCYKILGFDYESFGKNPPDTRIITKRYRSLGREWHPDKKKHKNAAERFVKIARAYEVLTDDETRKEYDFMRYNQDAYFRKYGSSVLFAYAPKSDVTLVIVIILIVSNVFSWYSQQHRWKLVADRLIKAAVEDWTPSMGGTPESKSLREEALQILQEREKKQAEERKKEESSDSSSAPKQSSGNSKKKAGGGKNKVSGKERKKLEQEALRPIVAELVHAMEDFGAGFHKPTWRDLLIVSMSRMPYDLAVGAAWNAKYLVRRLQKKELNAEEREVLTQRAVGHVVWEMSSENQDERTEMIKRELWIKENLLEWKEEQEIKKLSPSEQKYYNKLKKKGKLE